jgi:hypothetical protein
MAGRPDTPIPDEENSGNFLDYILNTGDDTKIEAFRKELNQWKRDHLVNGLENEKDDQAIDSRVEKAREFMKQVNQHLTFEDVPTEGGGEQEVKNLLDTLGSKDTWTESLLDKIHSILLSDLYEYPLTVNTNLIDQFQKENLPAFE